MEMVRCSSETVCDWFNYCREVCVYAVAHAAALGGPGEVVRVDESYLRGRRKYNRGRLMAGNEAGPARQNYGYHVVGPWVFGLVWKRADETRSVRLFSVLRRNVTTLRPLIQQHVAAGTVIYSDQWRAYGEIPTWGAYLHHTVNKSQNFADPVTGVNMQRIESHWAALKTKILREMRGTNQHRLVGYLAAHSWFVEHQQHPFMDFLAELRLQFPIA